MHLTAALLVVVAAVTIAAPVQLSEEMLEEINALRAQGLSEVCLSPSSPLSLCSHWRIPQPLKVSHIAGILSIPLRPR